MNPLWVSYSFASAGERRALAVHLEPSASTRPTADLLRDLHTAANTWAGAQPDIHLRADLLTSPPAHAVRRPAMDYLYATGASNGGRLKRHLDALDKQGRLHFYRLLFGAPVAGADLVGRAAPLLALQRALGVGSAHLRAPRRYGKTSLLRQLRSSLAASGTPCAYLDVSPGSTPSWFLVALAQDAMTIEACRKTLRKLPELASWPPADAEPSTLKEARQALARRLVPNPWSFGRRLLEAMGALDAVLLIDEFSVFLRRALDEGRSDAERLAELLRVGRQAATSPARQVLAGSSGLSSYVRFHDLGHLFDDLAPIEVPPLQEDTATALAEELLYSQGRLPYPEAGAQVLAEIGEPVPFYIHALIQAACDETESGDAVGADTLRRAYRERILGTRGNDLFGVYRLAHQPYPPAMKPVAARLLKALAARPMGLTEAQLTKAAGALAPALGGSIEPLLACLEEDYDLVLRNGRWAMRCKVLRDRWMQEEQWLTSGAD